MTSLSNSRDEPVGRRPMRRGTWAPFEPAIVERPICCHQPLAAAAAAAATSATSVRRPGTSHA